METAAPGASRPTLAAVGIQSTTSRLLFVDNIRVLLTILVLLFHLMITYAGTGDWWYMEGREDAITGVIGAWFLVVNQAYFMRVLQNSGRGVSSGVCPSGVWSLGVTFCLSPGYP